MIFLPGRVNLLTVGGWAQIQGGFLQETITLLAAMTSTPDSTRQELINETINDLKEGGIWTQLDCLWMLACHDPQAGLLDWKRYKDATETVAGTWTTDRGWQGNGTSSYITTNFTPNSHGVAFQLNTCSFGVYSRTDNAVAQYDMGSRNASSANANDLSCKWSDNNAYIRVNHSGGGNAISMVGVASTGLFVARRTASNASHMYRNGSQLGSTFTNASNARPGFAHTIGALNAAGTVTSWSNRQFAAAFEASAMGNAQQSNLYTIIQAYMTAIGANV